MTAYTLKVHQVGLLSTWLIDNKTIFQVQVRNLDQDTTYYVWANGERGEFTTNKKGHGHFHFTIEEEDEFPFEGNIAIRTENNPGPNMVLYRQP